MEVQIRNPFSLLGRKLLLRFDMFAWEKMCHLNGKEFHELGDLNEQQLMLSWLYAAYLSGCASKYTKPKHDFRYIVRVYRWYYVNDHKVIAQLIEMIEQSKLMGKTVAEWKSEGEKKKSQ